MGSMSYERAMKRAYQCGPRYRNNRQRYIAPADITTAISSEIYDVRVIYDALGLMGAREIIRSGGE